MPHDDVFVPDGTAVDEALARTTHMAIGAHQDDIPIMAHHGILECFGRSDRWFLAVTATDGAGSPRRGSYADVSDDEMAAIRIAEERTAADVGEYGAAVQLGYSSRAVKDPADGTSTNRLTELIDAARPSVLYTHDLADRHDTHVAVALRTVAAVRALPEEARPQALYGCEVWRSLDWMVGDDLVRFDVSGRASLAAALIAVYDSQIAGGKRYDLATAGRRRANATFAESHSVDDAEAVIHAMDLMPLVVDPTLDPAEFVGEHADRLRTEVVDRIASLSL